VKCAGLTSCALQDGVQHSSVAATPIVPSHSALGNENLIAILLSFSMLRGYSRWLPTVFIRRRMRVQSERFFAHSAFPANARRLENE